MAILVVSDTIPMPDRSSGCLRLTHILEWLARHEEIHFAHVRPLEQLGRIGAAELKRYRAKIEALGIRIIDPVSAAGSVKPRCIFFESDSPARRWIVPMRHRQPAAIMIVDSVDVHYARLFAQAGITGLRRDLWRARRAYAHELAAYRAADLVVVVSKEDEQVLLRDVPGLRTFEVPNIHSVPPLDPAAASDSSTLVFVGGFDHEPNVDAMLWFCREALPLIAESVPEVRLKIIGSNVPQIVRALASSRVEVLGFVPETTSHLRASAVSVAPLRFGAGMKGKVGEALALGIPVVSTTVGIAGMGLTPGVNVLVGDTARLFADAVIALLGDQRLRARLGAEGREIIALRYSETAVAGRLNELFNTVVPSLEPRRPSLGELLAWAMRGRHAARRELRKTR